MDEPLDAQVGAISRACGRDISRYDAAFLAKSLEKRLAAAGCDSTQAYLDRLAADPDEAEAFYRSLNITHSEFFRNPLTFAFLEKLVLPRLIEEQRRAGRPEVRVWSAACAAGQEAYSVAILLDELAARRGAWPSVRIFASDIAADELAVARAGVYNVAALQNVRLRHLHACFTGQGDTWALLPRIRERVDFSVYDLLDPRLTCPPASIYGDFDLILCCNVLMYYGPQARRFILDKLRGCLAPAGYLATGEAERTIVEQAGGFDPVAPPVAVFQKAAGRNRTG